MNVFQFYNVLQYEYCYAYPNDKAAFQIPEVMPKLLCSVDIRFFCNNAVKLYRIDSNNIYLYVIIGPNMAASVNPWNVGTMINDGPNLQIAKPTIVTANDL
jgi:hypothetical protein